ncbi:hypothetical protein F5B20DRAFT_34961 [Whalleya microplaca]|nr:hypothetical protein F5B20DRAFT_34961 [Whalleya microplaca]
MARLTQVPITPRRSASNPDSLTDLNRLLARLRQNLLHADAERERRLRTSEYERNKVGINLEYARTLLTKLEQDALAVKVHARRQELQTDLNRKREVFEQLAERLRELEDISVDSDDDDDSSEGEDLLGEIIQTPSESLDSREADREEDNVVMVGDYEDRGEAVQLGEIEDESTVLPRQSLDPASTASEPPQSTASASTQPEPQPQPTPQTAPSPHLRARTSAAAQPTPPPTDTATSSALRTQLFGNAPRAASPSTTATATTEAIMDHQRAEQDKLTESMVGMARALKASTHAFSSALREDQDVLAAAGSGLERSGRGLEGVAGRMGSLRRLTEGKGWWGRVLLYAWIFGLAVAAVLIVFVLPKLRF